MIHFVGWLVRWLIHYSRFGLGVALLISVRPYYFLGPDLQNKLRSSYDKIYLENVKTCGYEL